MTNGLATGCVTTVCRVTGGGSFYGYARGYSLSGKSRLGRNSGLFRPCCRFMSVINCFFGYTGGSTGDGGFVTFREEGG